MYNEQNDGFMNPGPVNVFTPAGPKDDHPGANNLLN